MYKYKRTKVIFSYKTCHFETENVIVSKRFIVNNYKQLEKILKVFKLSLKGNDKIDF